MFYIKLISLDFTFNLALNAFINHVFKINLSRSPVNENCLTSI